MNLMGLRSVIRQFKGQDPFMSAQVMEVFLTVCIGEDLTILDLGHRLGIPKSTASRHVSYLGQIYRAGKPGLKLVETTETVSDRRTKTIRLTDKGRALRDEIQSLNK